MDTGLKNILSTLCSRVELTPNATGTATDIYLLGDVKEAKLAYDLLFAHGCEVKFYPDPDANEAKFYINNSSGLAAKFPAVLAHAQALKAMKQSLDTLCRDKSSGVVDFTFNLVPSGNDGKQISIALTAPIPEVSIPKPAAIRRTAPPATKRVAIKKAAPEPDNVLIGGGTELAKKYPLSTKYKKDIHRSPFRQWLSRLFIKKIAGSGIGILAVIVGSAGIITLFIMSQGFLCPDFANAEVNHAWYCIPK